MIRAPIILDGHEMQNVQEARKLLDMLEQLNIAYRNEVPYLQSKGNEVPNPELKIRVKRSIRGLLVVYLFAMWDTYVDRELEDKILNADERHRLRAYRHIRHSCVHGFNGKRARQCRNEFDKVMESDNAFRNVILDKVADKIEICDSQIDHDCKNLISDLAYKVIDRLANSRDEDFYKDDKPIA